MKKIYSILTPLFISVITFAQSPVMDSLNRELSKAKDDTTRLNILYELGVECDVSENLKYSQPVIEIADRLLETEKDPGMKLKLLSNKAAALNNVGYYHKNMGNIEKAMEFYEKSLKLQEKIGDKKEMAFTLNNMGIVYDNNGNTLKALEYFYKSIDVQKQSGDKKALGYSYHSIGVVFGKQGDVINALNNFTLALRYFEETKEQNGIARSLLEVGNVYKGQKDNVKALEYYNKSLVIQETLDNRKGMAYTLNQIGGLYFTQGKFKISREFFDKCLTLFEETDNKNGVGTSYGNIGSVYNQEGNFPEAIRYYEKSLSILKQLNNLNEIAANMNALGNTYLKFGLVGSPAEKQNRLKTAYRQCDSALSIAKAQKYSEIIRNTEQNLSKIDSALGNPAGAFAHYKQFILYRDLITNETTQKASIKSQFKFEYEKKEAVIKEQQEKERAVALEKSRFQQIVIVSVILGLLMVAGFALFVFRTLKQTRIQKIMIEEKQREIIDSIRYAKRIQRSMLPSEKQIDKLMERLKN